MAIFDFILISLLILAVTLVLPYLNRYRVFQFGSLLFLSITAGILVTILWIRTDLNVNVVVMSLLLIGGIIYRAVRFYREHLRID